ncbi:MAG TPA: phospholipase D-like domain-containing protein, partial [Verrucomicrobiota bacterium]|nr:phospholipase D-like domain-containing protein [Verrucomicrobiota bacterium]
MGVLADNQFKLLPTGNEAFTAMLSAIDNATSTIRLETYIYRQDNIGDRFRQSLIAAAKRGVKVNVLIDGFGSYELPESFWNGLKSAGGKVCRFNPLTFSKFAFRDHRKILVCDDNTAFIGGFNIAQEYEGDGVNQGWCDHGAECRGSLVPELSVAFDEMFEKAHLEHSAFERFKLTKARRAITYMHGTLILSGPGRGGNIFKKWLINDLKKAHNVWIEMAYFLPPWRIRRMFSNIISRRKGNVKLILAGKTDVKIAKLAAQNLYWRLLRRGIEIYEYQPQILHAKLMVVDDILYIGSANLDTR